MKQLYSAGFTLRSFKDAGVPWKELVIFLRATHTELVAAGYGLELDPKDKVFRDYKPE